MIKDAEATAINATGGADVFDFGYLDYLSFTQESIDFGLWYSPEEIEKSPPGTIVLPDSWPVDNKSAIPTSLILGDVMKKFANIMQLTLEGTARRYKGCCSYCL